VHSHEIVMITFTCSLIHSNESLPRPLSLTPAHHKMFPNWFGCCSLIVPNAVPLWWVIELQMVQRKSLDYVTHNLSVHHHPLEAARLWMTIGCHSTMDDHWMPLNYGWPLDAAQLWMTIGCHSTMDVRQLNFHLDNNLVNLTLNPTRNMCNYLLALCKVKPPARCHPNTIVNFSDPIVFSSTRTMVLVFC
jgi:hypothetical protein